MHEVLSLAPLVRGRRALRRVREQRISNRLWQYHGNEIGDEWSERVRDIRRKGFCAIVANERRVEGLDKMSSLDQRQIWQCDAPHKRDIHWSRAHTLIPIALDSGWIDFRCKHGKRGFSLEIGTTHSCIWTLRVLLLSYMKLLATPFITR